MSALDFFISTAYAVAPSTGTAAQPSAFSPMFIMVAFVILLYFTVWRPQNKRAKEQQSLLDSLKEGDEVVTIGGIAGKIAKMTPSYIVLTVSENNQLTVQKNAISTLLPKGTLKSL